MTDQIVYYQGAETRVFPWGAMAPGDEFLCDDQYAQNVWGRPDGAELAAQLTGDAYWGPYGLKTRDAGTKQPDLPDVSPDSKVFSTAALTAEEHKAELATPWTGAHYSSGFYTPDAPEVGRLGLETPTPDDDAKKPRGRVRGSHADDSNEGKAE